MTAAAHAEGEDCAPGAGPLGLARVDLDFDPVAAGQARQFIRRACVGWDLPAAVCQDAVSVTSELVTNAVVHARARPTLTLELGDGHLTVRVFDSSTVPPRPAVPGGEPAESGAGLLIVERLTENWGHGVVDGGKVVWAVLRILRDGPERA